MAATGIIADHGLCLQQMADQLAQRKKGLYRARIERIGHLILFTLHTDDQVVSFEDVLNCVFGQWFN